VTEWFKVSVLKTEVQYCTVSSNPTLPVVFFLFNPIIILGLILMLYYFPLIFNLILITLIVILILILIFCFIIKILKQKINIFLKGIVFNDFYKKYFYSYSLIFEKILNYNYKNIIVYPFFPTLLFNIVFFINFLPFLIKLLFFLSIKSVHFILSKFIDLNWLIPLKKLKKSKKITNKITTFILTGTFDKTLKLNPFCIDLFNIFHKTCLIFLFWFFFQKRINNNIINVPFEKFQKKIILINSNLYRICIAYYANGFFLKTNKVLFKSFEKLKFKRQKTYKFLLILNWFIGQHFCYWFLKIIDIKNGIQYYLNDKNQFIKIIQYSNIITNFCFFKFLRINTILLLVFILNNIYRNHYFVQKKIVPYKKRNVWVPIMWESYDRVRTFLFLNINLSGCFKQINFILRFHLSRFKFFLKFVCIYFFYWILFILKIGRRRI
jgi:hypothetical protein